eukprot:243826-Chlamydomonas_euryale.AAC.6
MRILLLLERGRSLKLWNGCMVSAPFLASLRYGPVPQPCLARQAARAAPQRSREHPEGITCG